MSDVSSGKGVVYCPPLIDVNDWNDNKSDGKNNMECDELESYKHSYK